MITERNQLEYRHLRYFLVLAEELHFRRAADKLYISQPGLSKQIKQLEDILGFSLLERSSRLVKLTYAGQYLKKELEVLIKNMNNTLSHAQMISEGNEGIIRVGYVGSAMQKLIPELLITFSQKFPGIQFSLKEMDNQKQLEELVSHQIDVGFIRMEEVPNQLKVKPVFEESFSIVLPEDHPINEKNFTNLSQLKTESFIFFEKSYSPAYYGKIMSIFEDSGFTPSVSHSTVHANTIFRLVENRFGLSIVPSSLQLGYNLKVKFIELINISQRAILYMSWHRENRNPVVEKLLQLI